MIFAVVSYVGLYKGRDWINTQDWTQDELKRILDVGLDLKRKFRAGEPHEYLKGKTLFMIFYNRSLRTRNSFEAGMHQLGGHAHFLSPEDVYTPVLPGDDVAYSTERISDVARVLARYGQAIAIRIYGKHAKFVYGRGNQVVREFAKWSDAPVINMECDMYHPCQAMADIMAVKERFNDMKGKKFVMSWAYTPSVEKPMAVPQSAALIATQFGLDVTLAHPKGFELDPQIIKWCKDNANRYGGSFDVSYDMKEAFNGAHILYPKSWWSLNMVPPKTKRPNFAGLKRLFGKNKSWITDQTKMDLTAKNSIYMHCLPADRGYEVTDDVIDGPQSVVFDEAENRLHAQKAIMAMTM